MVATMIPVEEAAQTVILRNITWPLYRQLLAKKQDSGNPRFAYNQGTLEITVPSFEHEEINRLLADVFATLADELGIDFINAGSTTFDRREREQGFEPDTCFYVQHAEGVRGKRRINLKSDPPPDLVIEIDITSPSLNKFPIFAGLGIPEVWRYHHGRLAILQLSQGEYHEQPASQALPGVTSEHLTQFITTSRQAKRAVWLREVRAWAQMLKTTDGASD
jgi:Uma2 family endonuclease